MRFRFGSRPDRLSGRQVVYRPNDLSFDVEPPQAGFTSVVVNELSLEVDESGRVTSVWGYCPYPAWARSKVTPPHADFLEVFAVSSEQFLRGVSQSVNLDERWPVFVDQQSGWVSLDSGRPATQLAEVLPGAVLGLDDNQQLAALYLKPDRLPQLR
jgi:hypothetical protein